MDSWSWTPDGQSLLINENGVDISMVTLGGDQERQPVLEEAFNEGVPEISPDGPWWIAYRSNETGQLEVFVRPFPDVAGGRWQVSHNWRQLPGMVSRRSLIEGDYVFAPGQGRNQSRVVVKYLQLAVWPRGLVVYFGLPQSIPK